MANLTTMPAWRLKELSVMLQQQITAISLKLATQGLTNTEIDMLTAKQLALTNHLAEVNNQIGEP